MAINSSCVKKQIERLKQRIIEKEEEIEDIKKEIILKEDELKKIEEYENSPIEERTLRRYIFDTTASVRVMDEFESITEEGYQKYKRMIFRNSFYSDCGSYNFIVERLQARDSEGNITMTDYKKGYDSALRKYANEQIKMQLGENRGTKGTEIFFDKPYLLRTQNSSNRTGYGSEYNGYDLVYQGTLYGETTRYGFVGVVMD